jgi:hypothetical protein
MNAIYLPIQQGKPLYIGFSIQGLSGNNRWIWRLTPLLNSATQTHFNDRDENGILATEVFQSNKLLMTY